MVQCLVGRDASVVVLQNERQEVAEGKLVLSRG